MIILLKLPNWIWFLFTIGVIILTNINPLLSVFFFVYPVLVALGLRQYLHNYVKLNYPFFIFNCSLLLIGNLILNIFFNGEIQATGLKAIPFIYIFYALFNFLSFPVKVLRSIELGYESTFRDHLLDIFLVFFLPIGIWFLQTRVNKIIDFYRSDDNFEYSKAYKNSNDIYHST